MKRLLCCAAALLFLLPALPKKAASAAEEERYAVAAQTDVWFYAAEDEESGLFLLPYTYYVRVIREGTLYTAVRYLDDVQPYKSVTGFCKTEALTFVDFVPERPFLRKEITAVYSLPSAPPMGKGSFDKLERTFVYYGASYAGTAKYYYVYADGVFDYIPAVQEVLFELNTDYLRPSSGEAEEPPPPAEESSSLSPLQIVLLSALALAVVLVAVLVVRGRRPSPSEAEV